MKTFEELMAELSGPPPGASSVMDSYAAPSSPVKTFEELMAELKGPPPPPPPPELLRAPAPEPIVPLPSTQSIFDQQPQAALGAAPPSLPLPTYQPPPAPEPYVSPIKPLPLADQFPMRQTALTTPEIVQPAPAPPAPTPFDPISGYEPGAFVRGLVSGSIKGNPEGMGAGLEAIGIAAKSDLIRQQGISLASLSPADLGKFATTGGDLFDAKSIGEFMTSLGEQVGGAAASSLPSIVGGGVGATVAGPAGAAVGARAGAAVPSYLLNTGDLFKALKEAGANEDQAAHWATIVGIPIAALDVFSLEATTLGAKELRAKSMKALAGYIVKQGGVGFATEGGTEAIQQAIQVGTVAGVSDKPFDPMAAAKEVATAGLVGGIVGGGTEVASGAYKGARSRALETITPEDAATQAQALKDVTGRSPLTATGEPVPVTDETGRQDPNQAEAANPPATERQAAPVPLQIEPKKFTFAARAIHAAADETGVDAALQAFDAARNAGEISEQTYEREHAKLLDIADRRLQVLEEERQRADLEQAATSQQGAGTSETGNIPTATGKMPEVSGEMPTSRQNVPPESIDLRGAGTAIADNLHDMLWKKVQKGDITEAGAPSRALIAAKEERAKGGLNTKEEARAFFQRYATQQNATPERPASPPEPAKMEPAPITPAGDIAAPEPPQKAPEPEVDELDITTPLSTPAEEPAPQVDEPTVESETAKGVLDGYLEQFPVLREILTGVDDHTQYPAQALKLAQAQGHADLSKMDAVTYTDVDGKEKVAINVGMLKGNPLEVVTKVAHEVGIHLGLEKALGKEGLQEFGQTIFHTMSPEQQQAISQSHKYDLEKDQHQIGQEHAAIEAERLIREGTAYKGTEAWSKIVAAARAAWRSFVTRSGLAFNPSALPFTDRELAVALTKGWKAATGTPGAKTADLTGAIQAQGQTVDQSGLRASVTPGSADLWNVPQQEITSSGTSQSQIPKVVSYLTSRGIIKPGMRVADIGGGRYELANEAIAKVGATNHIFDPFNRDAAYNAKSLAAIKDGQADVAMVNNVLNTIKEPEIRQQVISQAANTLKAGGTAYFQVYHNPTRNPNSPSKGWQEHRPAATYVPEIEQQFGTVKTMAGGIIAASNPKTPTGNFRASVSKQPAPAPAPVFYSQVERTIDEKMQNRARSTDVLKMLENTQGVKGEELEWTRLKDFLGEQKVVTKQEVKDFLAENQVKIEEVVKGDKGGVVIIPSEDDPNRFDITADDRRGSLVGEVTKLDNGQFETMTDSGESETFDTQDEAVAWFNDKRPIPQTKFSQYTLPGGENYRELLLTMPPQSATGKEQYEMFPKTGKDLYHSSHYDEPNILAHIRFNERTDAEGKRVLFIEEIQSDWHQAGRDAGYIGDKPKFEKLPDGYTIMQKKEQEAPGNSDNVIRYWVTDNQGRQVTAKGYNRESAINEALNTLNRRDKISAVPNAPLKKTWHELAMKRALRWAAENGFDRVAWTTGAQQVERYPNEMRKTIDRIQWSKADENGDKFVEGIKGKDVVFQGTMKPDGVFADYEAAGKSADEVVGKSMAAQIATENGGTIEGKDFTIGGEGMKGFYDQMLPSFVNKYAKKWGAKVGTTEIPSGTNWKEVPGRNGGFAHQEDGDRYIPVHMVDVSPAMRESVMGGQARFSVGKPADEAGATSPRQIELAKKEWAEKRTESRWFKRWFGGSKVVDDSGKPLVVYHGTHKDITTFRKTSRAHLGFHFGDQEAAQTRLEQTAKERVNTDEVDRQTQVSEEAFAKLSAFRDELHRKNGTIPPEEFIAGLDSGKDIDEILSPYQYQPTASETSQLQSLEMEYQKSKLPIFKFGEGARTGAYYLSIKNPLRMPDVGDWGSPKTIKESLPWDSDAKTLNDIIEEIWERGYDGIVYSNVVENRVMKTDSYIALDPAQAKSATGNRGTFSPDNPDIRFSVSKPTNTPQEDAAQVRAALYGTDPQAAVQALWDVHLGHGKENTPESLREVWGERIERVNTKKPLDPAVYAAIQQAMTEPAPAAEPPTGEPAPATSQKEPLKKGWKERSFPGTLSDAGLPPGEDLIYRVISNKESAAAGHKAWMDDPEDAERIALEDTKGSGGAKQTAISIAVIAGRQQQYTETRQQAQAATDPEQKKALEEKADRYLSSALAVASKTAARMTKAGQEIQAAKLLSVLTPESLIYRANREIDKQNEDVTDESKKKRLSKEIVDRLVGKAKQLEGWGQMQERVQTLEAMAKELAATNGTPTAESIQEFRSAARDIRGALAGFGPPRNAKTAQAVPTGTTGERPAAEPKAEPAKVKIASVRLRDRANAARERLGMAARETTLGMGVDPQRLADIAMVGADWVINDGYQRAQWTQQMLKDFANDFSGKDDPQLAEAWGMTRAEAARDRRLKKRADALLAKIDAEVARIENDPRIVSTPDVEVIREAMDAVKTLAGEEQVALAGEIHRVIRALHAPTAGEKIAVGLHIARLLNPKTIGRNIIGNELFWRTERLKHATAAALDYAYSKSTGKERIVTYAPAGGTYWADFAKGARLAWRGVNPGGLDTGFDLPTQRAFKGKIMGTLEKSLGVALRATDYAAAERARKSVMNEFATRAMREQGFTGDAKEQARWKNEWAEKADANINEMAREYGKYATFQDDNAISRRAVGLQKGLGPLAPFLFPYAKTPANLIARGLDYSPAGFVKAAAMVIQNRRAGKDQDRRQILFDLTRGLIGTGFGALGWLLLEAGVLTGAGDDDPDVRKLKAEQTGERGYQVNLDAVLRFFDLTSDNPFSKDALRRRSGDALWSYDWAMPFSFSLASGVNAGRALLNKELKKGGVGIAEAGIESALGAATMLGEQPLLQTLQAIGVMAGGIATGNREQAAAKAANILEGIPASFVPTILNQMRQFKDNTARETGGPATIPWVGYKVQEEMLANSINRVFAKLPWVSEELPKAYKTLGIDVPRETYQNGGNNLLNVFFNPAFVAEYHPDPMVVAFLEPYNQQRETAQVPRGQSAKIQISAGDMRQATGKRDAEEQRFTLEGADRQEMQRTMAGWTTRKMAEVMKGRYLEGRTPKEQTDALVQYVLNPAADQARQWFIKNRLKDYLKTQ